MESTSPDDGTDVGPGSLRKTSTHPCEKSTPPEVQRFVEGYYENAAKATASHAVKLLKDDSELKDPENYMTTEYVQAWVTCRAKTTESLLQKLIAWNEEKEFKSQDQIKKVVKDLAGVRVILSIPSRSQYDKVGEIIRRVFKAENVEPHNPRKRTQNAKDPPMYQPMHLGYQGEHYWVQMKGVSNSEDYKYRDGDSVEIQVTSVMGHAWATAQHDVLYKTNRYGPASVQEHLIMDAVNGLVISADLLLQQSRDLLMARSFAKLEDTYGLETYLQKSDILQSVDLSELMSREHAYMILNLLKKKNKNYPLAIRETLKELGFPKDSKLGMNNILATFQPSFKPAEKMGFIVCLAHKLLEPQGKLADGGNDNDKQKTKADDIGESYGERQETRTINEVVGLSALSACNRSRIIVNTLLLIQDILGHEPDVVRDYLLDEVKLKGKVRSSITWFLEDSDRRYILKDNPTEQDQRHIDNAICHGWEWFGKEAHKPASICGLAFRLVAIEATEPFKTDFLTRISDIGSLYGRVTVCSDNKNE